MLSSCLRAGLRDTRRGGPEIKRVRGVTSQYRTITACQSPGSWFILHCLNQYIRLDCLPSIEEALY